MAHETKRLFSSPQASKKAGKKIGNAPLSHKNRRVRRNLGEKETRDNRKESGAGSASPILRLHLLDFKTKFSFPDSEDKISIAVEKMYAAVNHYTPFDPNIPATTSLNEVFGMLYQMCKQTIPDFRIVTGDDNEVQAVRYQEWGGQVSYLIPLSGIFNESVSSEVQTIVRAILHHLDKKGFSFFPEMYSSFDADSMVEHLLEDEEDESGIAEAKQIIESQRFLTCGHPAKLIKKIRSNKNLIAIDLIDNKIKSLTDKKWKRVLLKSLPVLRSEHSFSTIANRDSYSEGLYPENYMGFVWSFSTPFEESVFELFDSTANEVGIIDFSASEIIGNPSDSQLPSIAKFAENSMDFFASLRKLVY
jgi:hypothetical protein